MLQLKDEITKIFTNSLSLCKCLRGVLKEIQRIANTRAQLDTSSMLKMKLQK